MNFRKIVYSKISKEAGEASLIVIKTTAYVESSKPSIHDPSISVSIFFQYYHSNDKEYHISGSKSLFFNQGDNLMGGGAIDQNVHTIRLIRYLFLKVYFIGVQQRPNQPEA